MPFFAVPRRPVNPHAPVSPHPPAPSGAEAVLDMAAIFLLFLLGVALGAVAFAGLMVPDAALLSEPAAPAPSASSGPQPALAGRLTLSPLAFRPRSA